MNKSFLVGIGIIVFILGCQSANSPIGILKKIERNIKKNPTPENFDLYFSEATNLLNQHKEDKDLVKSILERSASLAIENERYSNASGFLMPLVKDYPDDPKRSGHLLDLANIMKTMNKDHAATTLYSGYKDQYPDGQKSEQLETLLGNVNSDITQFVDTIFNSVFVNPDEYGLNRVNALKFVDVAEAYALVYPDSEQAPFYLYRAGEIARSIRTLPKALSIYDWILESYPNYEKTPTVLFLKGFILENDMQDIDAARSVYEQFLASYPDHELTPSVKFLIENLGKSDEEILDFIEQQRNKNEGKDKEPNS